MAILTAVARIGATKCCILVIRRQPKNLGIIVFRSYLMLQNEIYLYKPNKKKVISSSLKQKYKSLSLLWERQVMRKRADVQKDVRECVDVERIENFVRYLHLNWKTHQKVQAPKEHISWA